MIDSEKKTVYIKIKLIVINIIKYDVILKIL